MLLSSKPKKIKPKGTFRELRLVQNVNHHGVDTIKAEVVKTPQQGSEKMPLTSHCSCTSSSIKHLETEIFDLEPIPCDLEEPDLPKKCQMLVFLFLSS
jgi:hypothetical protein